MAAAALGALLGMAVGRGEETVSPRGFCLANGGEVVETGDPAVHICCYTHRQRCVEVNEHSRTSVRVSLAHSSVRSMSVTKQRLDR